MINAPQIVAPPFKFRVEKSADFSYLADEFFEKNRIVSPVQSGDLREQLKQSILEVAKVDPELRPQIEKLEEIEVLIADNEQINAFADPENKIVVFNKGLLRKITHKEEIDFVTLHEVAHIILMGGLKKFSDLFGRSSEDSADMVATAWALEGGAHFETLESIFLPGGLLHEPKTNVRRDDSLIGRLTSEHGQDASRVKRMNTTKGIWLNRISHATESKTQKPTPWQPIQNLDDLKHVSYFGAYQTHCLRHGVTEIDFPAEIFKLDPNIAFQNPTRCEDAADIFLKIDRAHYRDESAAWIDRFYTLRATSGFLEGWKPFLYKTFYHILLSNDPLELTESGRLAEPKLYSLPPTPNLKLFTDAVAGFIDAQTADEALHHAERLDELADLTDKNPVIHFQRLAVKQFSAKLKGRKTQWHLHTEWAKADSSGLVAKALFKTGAAAVDFGVYDAFPISDFVPEDIFDRKRSNVLVLPSDIAKRDLYSIPDVDDQENRGKAGRNRNPYSVDGNFRDRFQWSKEAIVGHSYSKFSYAYNANLTYVENDKVNFVKLCEYIGFRFDREFHQSMFDECGTAWDAHELFALWYKGLTYGANYGGGPRISEANGARLDRLTDQYLSYADKIAATEPRNLPSLFFDTYGSAISRFYYHQSSKDKLNAYVMRDEKGFFRPHHRIRAAISQTPWPGDSASPTDAATACANYRTALRYEEPKNIRDIHAIAMRYALDKNWGCPDGQYFSKDCYVEVVQAEHHLLLEGYQQSLAYDKAPELCSFYLRNGTETEIGADKTENLRRKFLSGFFALPATDLIAILSNAELHDVINSFAVAQAQGWFEDDEARSPVVALIKEGIRSLETENSKACIEACVLLIDPHLGDNERVISGLVNHAELQRLAIDTIVSCVVKDIGIDDGSPRYLEHFEEHGAYHKLLGVTPQFRHELLWKLGDAVLSQRDLSMHFGDAVNYKLSESWNANASIFTHLAIGVGEYLSQRMQKSGNAREQLLHFLTHPVSNESVEDLCTRAHLSGKNMIDALYKYESKMPIDAPQAERMLRWSLQTLHHYFWMSSVDVRTLVIDQLLVSANAASMDADGRRKNGHNGHGVHPLSKNEKAALRLSLNLLIPITDELVLDEKIKRKLSRAFIGCYLEACDPSERSLAISNLLAAAPRGTQGSLNHAEMVALLLAHQGPAQKKIGQRITFSDKVPVEYRVALKHFRTRVETWPRWALFQRMDKIVPKSVRNQISYVDDLCGAASIWVNVAVNMKNGEQKALGMLRPKAKSHTNYGATRLKKSAEIFADRYPRHKEFIHSLMPLLEQGHRITLQETDTRYGAAQANEQKNLYDQQCIAVDGQTIAMSTMNWEGYGREYKLTPLATGPHFIDLEKDTEKYPIAFAMTFVGLQNILRGGVFWGDCHGGQCRIDGNHIQIFDPGGIDLKQPTIEDKRTFGRLIGSVIASGDYENVFSLISNPPRELLTNEYIGRIRESLWGLADFTSCLSGNDLMQIFVAVYKDDMRPMDPIFKEEIDKALGSMAPMLAFMPSRVERPKEFSVTGHRCG